MPTLNAKVREEKGKNAAHRYREQGQVSCVVLNKAKKDDQLLITIALDELSREMRHSSFTNTVYLLQIEGRTEPIPVIPLTWCKSGDTNVPLNVQFYVFDPSTKYRVQIPVRFEGEDDCIGIKKGGSIVTPESSISCSYIPTPELHGHHLIPECLYVDITNKKIGDTLRQSFVPLPKGLKLCNPSNDRVILTVLKQRGGH
jgi:large subunit ribosomal protein L25